MPGLGLLSSRACETAIHSLESSPAAAVFTSDEAGLTPDEAVSTPDASGRNSDEAGLISDMAGLTPDASERNSDRAVFTPDVSGRNSGGAAVITDVAGSISDVAGSTSTAHKIGMSRVYLNEDEEDHFDRDNYLKYRKS
jgi:hypothetical protein